MIALLWVLGYFGGAAGSAYLMTSRGLVGDYDAGMVAAMTSIVWPISLPLVIAIRLGSEEHRKREERAKARDRELGEAREEIDRLLGGRS